jgi:hypothetical protein
MEIDRLPNDLKQCVAFHGRIPCNKITPQKQETL